MKLDGLNTSSSFAANSDVCGIAVAYCRSELFLATQIAVSVSYLRYTSRDIVCVLVHLSFVFRGRHAVRFRGAVEVMFISRHGLGLTMKLMSVVDVLQGRVRAIKGFGIVLLRGRAYVNGQGQ
jgi:hypothetical protein